MAKIVKRFKQKSLLTEKMMVDVAVNFKNAIEMVNSHSGSFVGYGAWANYISLGIDNVGTVISTFNLFDTSLVSAIRLQQAGFVSVSQAEGAPLSKELGRCAMNIRNTWLTVFGELGEGVHYETALKYDNVVANHNGMEYVKVELDDVKECFSRAAKINTALPLTDIESFCRDAEAIKRFYGEYTIDATKKPEDFLREKPFFDYMKNVTQRSRQEFSVKIDRDTHTVKVEGASLAENVGEDGKVQPFLTIAVDKKGKEIQREDGNGAVRKFDCPDMFQEIRAQSAEYLKELATLCMGVPVQKLSAEELKKIANIKKDKDVNGGVISKVLIPALGMQRGVWQSMTDYVKTYQKQLERRYGKKSVEVDEFVKAQKQHNNVCYNAVTNNVRRLFESAGINDAVTRVRVLLAVVCGNLQRVEWDKLSSFAQSALPEEWFIYTMTMMRDDVWTPSETMDKLVFRHELSDVELAGLNGVAVTLEDGMLRANGIVIAHTDGKDLNGQFVLRVTDDGVYACHDIISLVKVPEADKNVTLFVTGADEGTSSNLDNILEKVTGNEVRLVPFNGNAIMVNGEKVGKFRCNINGKVNGLVNRLYGGAHGVKGNAVEVVRGRYEDEEKHVVRDIAVVVLKDTAAMTDEEVDGIGFTPEPEVPAKTVVAKAPVSRYF